MASQGAVDQKSMPLSKAFTAPKIFVSLKKSWKKLQAACFRDSSTISITPSRLFAPPINPPANTALEIYVPVWTNCGPGFKSFNYRVFSKRKHIFQKRKVPAWTNVAPLIPETSSNSASLTPLHLAGRDSRFSKLRALREEMLLQTKVKTKAPYFKGYWHHFCQIFTSQAHTGCATCHSDQCK